MRDWRRRSVIDARPSQAGLPLPGVEVSIRDDDGADVAFDGESMGALHVRGPWVTDGYLHGDGTGAASPRTAGSTPATSPSARRTATSSSPTAPRTSSSPAASGSPRSTWRPPSWPCPVSSRRPWWPSPIPSGIERPLACVVPDAGVSRRRRRRARATSSAAASPGGSSPTGSSSSTRSRRPPSASSTRRRLRARFAGVSRPGAAPPSSTVGPTPGTGPHRRAPGRRC